MSRFAFLVLFVQVCLIQTALCGLSCGNQISYAPSGCGLGGLEQVIEKYSVSAPSSVSAYEYSAPSVSYSAPSVSYSAPSISLSAPSVSLGASSISSGYGASYGGVGFGVVRAEGLIGASGTTAVAGSVPVAGTVAFSGTAPARGSVSIQGQCGCGCNDVKQKLVQRC
ncbi:chorion class A protein Ld2/Ld41-like [Cydia fagiglandana]|uniref:chorion class A protein Ld2/Ld41-like n=1 Tax=Cydia fagiglandana TaxID=1458189 RepID=UPI002FEE223F